MFIVFVTNAATNRTASVQCASTYEVKDRVAEAQLHIECPLIEVRKLFGNEVVDRHFMLKNDSLSEWGYFDCPF